MFNHQLAFRPLRGGVEIYNRRVDEVGTLGFIAEDVAGSPERWLVSCHHVLVGGPNDWPADGEEVFQPSVSDSAVAFVDAARIDATLDCAAAKLAPNIAAVSEILGVGTLSAPVEPETGMRLVKSGAATGVTEGTISEVHSDRIIIVVPEGFDPNYELSQAGDSGGLWLRLDDFAPVALHMGEIPGPQHRAKAQSIVNVLAALKFRLLV